MNGNPIPSTDPRLKHDVNEWLPIKYGKFCICFNENDGWSEPAYYDNHKFFIIRGFLKGKELPFVSHWRYMSPEEFNKFKDSK